MTSPSTGALDAYRDERVPGYLGTINPLASCAAIIPGIVGLIFVRDLVTPLCFVAFALLLLLTGARLRPMHYALLLLAVPLAVGLLGVSFAAWTDPGRVAASAPLLHLGSWTLYSGALDIGYATALRLAAIVYLSVIPGMTSTGPAIIRSAVQNLRVPYRVGYTALAAFRFVPRFRHELELIRSAHRVRGHHAGRGPFAAVARGWGYIVPLLASAIRHAERVALAMETRAFGLYPERTERHPSPVRARDAVFVAVVWAITAMLFLCPASR